MNSNTISSGQIQPRKSLAAGFWDGNALSFIAVALAYFCANCLALLVPDSRRVLAAIWPGGGVGLAALLLFPRRRWVVLLTILFFTGMASSLMAGRHFWTAVGFMVANMVETGGGAWFIERWCGSGVSFNKVREVRLLLVAATLVNAFSSCIGASTAMWASGANFWAFYRTWWIADGLGILLVCPLIVTWARPNPLSNQHRPRWVLELAAVTGSLLLLAWLFFGSARYRSPIVTDSYMLIIPLAWGALRLGPRGVMMGELALAIAAMALTIRTGSYFPLGGANETEHMLHVQLFLGVAGAIALLLAAAFVEGKSTEQSLRDVDASLRALGDNLPSGMVYQVALDPDGSVRCLYVSAGVERLNGLKRKDVLCDYGLLQNQIVEEDRPRVAAARQISMETMAVFNVVVRIRRTDGELRWMHFCSAPRRLPGGCAVWDGIETDITDEREAEQALRESEARYRALVEQAPIGITLSVNDQIVYANREAARIVGPAEPIEIIGRYTRDFIPEDLWHLVQARREKMMATGQPAPRVRRELKRLDGTSIDVEGLASPIMLEGRPAIQTIMVDSSDRKRAEDLIRRQLAFDDVIKGLLARLASASGAELDGQIQAGLRDLAAIMSSSAAVIATASPDEAAWSVTHEWFAPGGSSLIERFKNMPRGLFPRLEQRLLSGQIFRIEDLDHLKSEDQYLRQGMELGAFQAVILIPFRGQGGRVTGCMGILSTVPQSWREEDIQRLQAAASALAHAMERLRAEQHLLRYHEQLRALSARLQSLREEERIRIAREIHDHLGQLLTALSLDLRLIERKLSAITDPELKAALAGKVASARILADETITSVQKIATELRPAILDRLGLEAAIESEAQSFAARTGIECELNVPAASAPSPMESATACFRIFQEIMTNVVRHAGAKHVKVNFRRDEDRVLLQVIDDGVGIRHEDLLNPHSLGLLGMMERAEMLGGFAAFGRAKPNGTVVTVSLPLKARQPLPA